MADASSQFVPYTPLRYTDGEMRRRVTDFRELMDRRRSLRAFSSAPIPRAIIRDIILTASTAPSGAHKQPWTFCAVSDPEIKKQIRAAAEAEEYENYHGRMSTEWLQDLAPFETNWEKPFLEIAPWLIVVFKQAHGVDADGSKQKHYYVNESVGLATGLLLAAIHNAGLVALTHTPSPMNFLCEVLQRPANERPFLLIPVGYPPAGAQVPDLQRKGPEAVIAWYSPEE